jgi:hypothetical protein
MKTRRAKTNLIFRVAIYTGLTILIIAGCSNFDMPTATDSDYNHEEMWIPSKDFEIQSGHPIPVVNDMYWENLYGNATNPWIDEETAEINGDLGGDLELGLHKFEVSAGAVDGVMTFSLAYGSIIAVAVDCGPSMDAFGAPVILTLSYAGTQYDPDFGDGSLDPMNLWIYYLDDNGIFHPLENVTINLETRKASAPVSHFSRYVLG